MSLLLLFGGEGAAPPAPSDVALGRNMNAPKRAMSSFIVFGAMAEILAHLLRGGLDGK